MQKYFPIIIILMSCAQEKDLSQQSASEIEDADRAMSILASREGFNKALLQYADEDVVKPAEGKMTIIGKSNLEKAWVEPGTKSISWEPFRVEAAKSGDIGYSLGTWKRVTADTTLHGFYYTFWKKQKDGKWKFVLDGGNGSPAPAEE